jgi:hypothetical protein
MVRQQQPGPAEKFDVPVRNFVRDRPVNRRKLGPVRTRPDVMVFPISMNVTTA